MWWDVQKVRVRQGLLRRRLSEQTSPMKQFFVTNCPTFAVHHEGRFKQIDLIRTPN